MDKRIGKFLLLVCLVSSVLSCHDKAVHLYIQDMEQNPIRQAEKAVPFLLQVVADNVESISYPDDIPGFENFHVTRSGSSQSTSIMNGKKTQRIIFNYVLRGEQAGVFNLGPLSIQDNDGTKVASDTVQVRIGDKTITHNVKKQPHFLQIEVDKKSLYVGQGLTVSIRFYYVQDFENLRIVEPKFEDFHVGSIAQDVIDGKEVARGQEYHYKEWQIKVYPTKIGTLVIPPVQAVFAVQPNHFKQGLMGLFDVFGMNTERTVQASARSVEVQPLPESKQFKHVTAVGQFDKAMFEMQNDRGDIGEGLVAKLTVIGNGNVDVMKAPILQLPEGLRYYEANNSVKKLQENSYEKIFEYILQADKPGDFTIVSQKFVYFDSKDETYKSLKTNSASLAIVGEIGVKKDAEQQIETKEVATNQKVKTKKYQFKDNQINFVQETGLVRTTQETVLHQLFSWLLLFLGWLSLMSLCYWLYRAYFEKSVEDNFWMYYVSVRLQLLKIYKKQDVYGLYKLLQQICQRYNLDLQGDEIVQCLQKLKRSDAYIEKWKTFVHHIMAVIFSKKQLSKKEQRELLEQGRSWVKELLLCCKTMQKKQIDEDTTVTTGVRFDKK